MLKSDSESVMFIKLVMIAFLLRVSYSVALENCPFREKEWRSRGKKMNCAVGLSYHCLMDYGGNSTEFCLTRKEYDKRGCPWVLKRGERYFLGEPFTLCLNNTHCPIEGTTYYSDELYKYPACLVKEAERQNFILPESLDDSIRDRDSSSQNEYNTENNTVTVVIIVVLAVVVVVAAVVSLAACFIWKRKKGENEANNLSPGKAFEYHRYTWDIKKIIKIISKEDNPEKVKKLYSSLEGMDEKYYKQYVTRDGNTEGSILRYAVKMDRRETLLFFLQRQKNGQYVFEEDTYGAGKNSCVLDAAKEKGWSDVVDVLQGIHDPETYEEISDEPTKDVCMKLLRDDAEL